MKKETSSRVLFAGSKLGLTALAMGAFLLAYTQLDSPRQAAAAPAAKVQVCHIPPGNPDNFHTITISENAFAAHLAHGDSAGACNALCAQLCDDGDRCTIDDLGDCEENGCPAYPRSPVDCGESDQCYEPVCDPVQGCMNTIPPGTMCDDGEVCTELDVCGEDGCAGTDFGDECCLGDEACAPTNCNGAYCGTDHRCHEDPVLCDEPGLCQTGACSEIDGQCVYTEIECPPSGDACVISECSADTNGECGGTAVACDDQDVCTIDSCDSETGCEYAELECMGDACNLPIGCDPYLGCQYEVVSCDDGDRCTNDRCDVAYGGCRPPAPIPGCCNSDADCLPGQQCDETAPIPRCQSCVTALDNANGGSTSALIQDCEQNGSCSDTRQCSRAPLGDLIDCAVYGDRLACERVDDFWEAQGGCSICPPPPPPPPSACPCWDGSPTSAPNVSNVVELWEHYGPTTSCSVSDFCEDRMDSIVTRTSAECLTNSSAWMQTHVISNANQGLAQCSVVVNGQTLADQSFPRGSSQEAACVAEHDMYITLGGTFPNYTTTHCGLGSF